jgi:hypothetical protein
MSQFEQRAAALAAYHAAHATEAPNWHSIAKMLADCLPVPRGTSEQPTAIASLCSNPSRNQLPLIHPYPSSFLGGALGMPARQSYFRVSIIGLIQFNQSGYPAAVSED